MQVPLPRSAHAFTAGRRVSLVLLALAPMAPMARPLPAVAGAVARASTAQAARDAGPPVQAAMLREWRRRRWTLDAPGSGAELLEALGSSDWRERFDALDALARTAAASAWAARAPAAERVVALAVDPHPSVRAQALALVARAGLLAEVMQRHGDELVGEVFPDARVQLARAWSIPVAASVDAGPPLDAELARSAWELLVEWCTSPDERLSQAAFAALVGSGAWEVERVLAWLFDTAPERRTERWSAALAVLERADAPAARTDEWRLALERDGRLPAALPALEMMALRTGRAAQPARLEAELPALSAHEHWREALMQTARVRPPGLDELLWRAVAQAEGASSPVAQRLDFLVECASEASAPWRALSRARSLPAPRALAVWQTVRSRMRSWDSDEGAYWLAPGRERELRLIAAQALGATIAEDPSPQAFDALFELATDPDARLREFAFRRLADLPGQPGHAARLRVAWLTYDAAERLERLRDLPRRTAPLELRGDLLELGSHAATRSMSVIELLGLFSGDREVTVTLRGWLDAALDELDTTVPGDPGLRTRERRARALLTALVRTARAADTQGERAAAGDALAATLARSVAWIERNGAPTLELAEVAVASLGEELGDPGAAGAAVLLAPYLASAPERVRIEVALALAASADHAPAAQDLLARNYARLDGELRTRALRACSRAAAPPGLELLARVAADPGADWEQRFAAFHGLARSGRREPLVTIYASAREVDVRLACMGALASIPGDASRAFLIEVLTGLAPTAFAARPRDLDDEEHALLADEALLLLAARGELQGEQRALWLRRALASAGPDLEARFDDDSLPRADFRWRTELALARQLATTDQLATALEGAGSWYTLDADLLFALAEAVRTARPAIGAQLFRAARSAYAGQRESARTRSRVLEAELRLVELTRELGQPAEMEGWCRRLIEADRLGEDLLPLLERRFGGRDRERGVDPRARLASAAEQAAARAAIERGEPQLARRHAERARSRIGFSRAAAEAQTELEAFLSESRGR